MNNNILFFTCATGIYQNFVIPYIFFASVANKSASFEVLVNNSESFCENNQKSLEFFKSNGVIINIRSLPNLETKPHKQNSYRFIIEPELKAEYVYIGDVDIMITEEILPIHANVFKEGLPYSNIVRKGSKRLTGLHFAKYKEQYPLPEISDLVESVVNDEELLYQIMARKGMIYATEVYNGIQRPEHGIHMSFNRLPYFSPGSTPGWGMHWKYLETIQNIFEGSYFEEFFDTLNASSRMPLMNIIILSRGAISFGREGYHGVLSGKKQYLLKK